MNISESMVEQYKRELMRYAQKNGTLYSGSTDGFRQAESVPETMQEEVSEENKNEAEYNAEYANNRPMPYEYGGEEETAEEIINDAEDNAVSDSTNEAGENNSTPFFMTEERETDTNDGNVQTNEQRYRNHDDFIADNRKTGKLRVQTYAARRAFPVQNAKVTVEKQFDEGMHTFSETMTDADGVSENIILPTKSKEQVQTPSGEIPYATYTVRVEHPQFIPLVFYNVPIFDSIESLQPASMLPNNGKFASAEATIESEPQF